MNGMKRNCDLCNCQINPKTAQVVFNGMQRFVVCGYCDGPWAYQYDSDKCLTCNLTEPACICISYPYLFPQRMYNGHIREDLSQRAQYQQYGSVAR